MKEEAVRLERAGADLFLVCANTLHKLADEIRSAVQIPMIHVAEFTAKEILERKLSTVGLLGTRFTMEEDFYKNTLAKSGIKAIIPNEAGRNVIHRVIYDELAFAVLKDESRKAY